ncbi:hypothetical protein HMPREF9098_0421 [Kingella denitrificans ATCC 33394]|uniref:Uncharacterized protein n=1 Tax=Kingella denitrificans ATCC 33394 TaxID=888741 RepID=F0EX41_9NEIS|nr:hypothetical protein HMPREF9098_0421 [Kingella denitrificans ATCC 33394]
MPKHKAHKTAHIPSITFFSLSSNNYANILQIFPSQFTNQ